MTSKEARHYAAMLELYGHPVFVEKKSYCNRCGSNVEPYKAVIQHGFVTCFSCERWLSSHVIDCD